MRLKKSLAVGGRTDAADGVSFFDMFAEQMSANLDKKPMAL